MVKRNKKTDPSKKKSKISDDTEEVVESQGNFWAEAILDWGLHNNGTMMYLIKWEGYPDSDNSWEFQQHVGECSNLLIAFHSTKVNGRQPPKWSFDEFDKFTKYIEDLVQNEDLALLRKLSKRKINCFEIKDKEIVEENKVLLKTQLLYISKKFKKLKTRTNTKRLEAIKVIKKVINNLSIEENFGSISHFFDFMDRRRVITKELKEWEQQINEVIEKESEGKPIRVVNDVDLEKPKLSGYITDYILDVQFENQIKIKDEKPLISCQCDDCFESQDECCTSVIGFPMVYNNKGLLSSQRFNTIIYECNSECRCSQNCTNRQIQRGRQFELEIFRTDSETRGWGVRALQYIPKGSFITQYTGEIISIIEAEKRPSTYLFDLSAHLDFSDAEFTYVVDASQYGNVTRFVNHSCAPNCRVLFAWIKRSTNKLLPIIALFAVEEIKTNEELTYDYSMELIDFYNQNSALKYQMHNEINYLSEVKPLGPQVTDPMTSSQRRPNPRKVVFKRVECECGANRCRNFLYS